MTAVSGILTARGAPVPDGEVVLVHADGSFGGLSRTDADGRFALDGADGGDGGDGGDGALLVARLLADPVGATVVPMAGAPTPLALDAAGPWHELEVRVHTPNGLEHPDRLGGYLDPVRLAGVTAPSPRAAFLQTSQGSERLHFARMALARPTTTLHVQAGRWRIGAALVVYERPMLDEPGFHNVVVAHASIDGRELDGDAVVGFGIDVAGPLTVKLDLRVVEDDEL